MTDRQGTFRLHRNAAAKIPAPRTQEVFPVTTAVAPIAYQVKVGRKWITVAKLNASAAESVRKYQDGRGRKLGRDYKLAAVKTASK